MKDWRYWLAENRGTLFAAAIFVIMFAVYLTNHPAIEGGGFTQRAVGNVTKTAADKAVLLAYVAVAQALVVITAGIDLSVGMIFTLTNCVASHIVNGTPLQATLGALAVLGIGALCGAINGSIVIYGRLQPIVTTIATGAIYYGIALWLRPNPGGAVYEPMADFFTGKFFGLIPVSLVTLAAIVALVWVPFRRSVTGRAAYAVGSSEAAAYMSGVPIARGRFMAYTLSGLMAGCGGLFFTFFTYTGEANLANGNTYTLFSIAAVVLGGVSLFGGSGSAIGAIFGALAFRTIADLLFVFDIESMWQTLFQGLILMLAIAIGSIGLLRVRNRLDWFS